jgi:hypothetical protein
MKKLFKMIKFLNKSKNRLMKPIKFKHQNITFAEDQPLPVLKIETKNGEVISCWKISFSMMKKHYY